MADPFIRSQMLLGEAAMNVLKNSCVCIVGIGGVGCGAAESLARSGVGKLVLVDFDEVSASNINRQLIALRSTVGQKKVDVMAKRIKDISGDIEVIPVCGVYDEDHRGIVFDHRPDYIIDAIDSVPSKIDLIKTAKEKGIPIISAMGTGNKLDPLRLKIADIKDTKVCPLARVLRRELKKAGIEHHDCLYSEEPPKKPVCFPDDLQKESTPGSVSWVPPVAGMVLAGFVVRKITTNSGIEG